MLQQSEELEAENYVETKENYVETEAEDEITEDCCNIVFYVATFQTYMEQG